MTLSWISIQFLICAYVLNANDLPDLKNTLQIIFQYRTKIGYQFNRSFVEFEDGFTSPDGTGYWLGLKQLHNLTSSSEWNLLSTFQHASTGYWFWTELSRFKVGAPPGYNFTIDERVGGTFDITGRNWKALNNVSFATYDRYSGNICTSYSGGWWYSWCYRINPNDGFPQFFDEGIGLGANVTSLRLVKRTASDLAAKPVCPKESNDDTNDAFVDDVTFTIQSRKKFDVSFANKTFDEYENGFGLIGRTDFWVGLKELHNYTKSRICNLIAFFQVAKNKKSLWVEISDFKVGAGPEYTLSIGDRVDGNFDENLKNWVHSNNTAFGTIERDEDNLQYGSCLVNYGRGGWWYSANFKANPNFCLMHKNETSGNQELLEISASVLKLKEVK